MPRKFKKVNFFNYLIVKNMSLERILHWNKQEESN